MKILVTGGLGFIGSNFIKYMLKNYNNCYITNIDNITYAANPKNLNDSANDKRYTFVRGDICNRDLIDKVLQKGVDYICNFAAESHVDRSIDSPSIFVNTNIVGTSVLLDMALKYSVKKYIQISTDEVYGTLDDTGLFTEHSPICPSSPYSSSKASADLISLSYFKTYGLPVVITRCSNNYGPNQHEEKLIPMIITNALNNKEIPVYGDGKNIRDWIYVIDHCRAIDLSLRKGRPGQVYNIGSNNEKTNIEIVKLILEKLGKPQNLITYVKDRLGHDKRYAIDSSLINSELGFNTIYTFNDGLNLTIQWYKDKLMEE